MPPIIHAVLLATGLAVAWLMPSASRAASTAPAPTDAPSYTVQPGDTLTGIARRHGLTSADLLRLNDLPHPDRLVKGTVLRLPGANPTPPQAGADASGPAGQTAPASQPAPAQPMPQDRQPRPFVPAPAEPQPAAKPSPASPATAAPAAPAASAAPAAPETVAKPKAPPAKLPASEKPAPSSASVSAPPADDAGSRFPVRPSQAAPPKAEGATETRPGTSEDVAAVQEPGNGNASLAQRAVGVYAHPMLGTLRVAKGSTGTSIVVTRDSAPIAMRHLLYGTFDGTDSSGVVHSLHLEFNARGEVEALQYSISGNPPVTYSRVRK